MKIGIGLTTHNRPNTFSKALQNIVRYAPLGSKIVVVDDASVVPASQVSSFECIIYFRFEQNVGIAHAKNKCFELLDDCDHIILFDDDTWPIADNWWKPYVESKEPHLMYIFQDFIKPRLHDTTIVYQDSNIIASSHPRGCMLYYSKECLRKVGGMDQVFGKWGYEHGDLSNRIFNSGITSFRYMDVPNSGELFYSSDEHETVGSTVTGLARIQQIRANKDLAASRKYSAQYVPYKEKRDIVITTFFTKVKDPQRNVHYNPDDIYPLTLPLRMSLVNQCDLVILNDCGKDHVDSWEGTNIRNHWVNVETSINPYFQRWVSIMQYLRDNRESIGKVFCVDATDVEMLKNPFRHMDNAFIYCGNEPEKTQCTWLVRHHQHPAIQKFIQQNKDKELLNAGLLGGSVERVMDFCRKIIDTYSDMVLSKEGPGMTDMGIFNYLMRQEEYVCCGEMVHTKFKANERNNISFWKHK